MQVTGCTGVGPCAGLRSMLAALAAVVALSIGPIAHGQTDDFNDGNDTGWTRYSPLTPFGGAGTFTFPEGGYRIQAPNPSMFGPARVGSLRQDVSYSRFFATVDIVNWDNVLDQSFGILARVREPGLGSTDGYSFTYSTQGPSVDISRIENEAPFGVAALGIPALDPSQDYRLVFEGDDTLLTGTLYNLADLGTPLATISGNDGAYASGITGLVVFDNSGGGSTADATFDNYAAAVVPEPGSAAALLVPAALALRRRWRA
jgi:hypothetical protein